MPMSRLLAGTSVMSLPSTRTRPPSRRSRPASTRSAVVLPQPEGPSSATSSPGAIVDREAVEGADLAVVALEALELDGDAGAGGQGAQPSSAACDAGFARPT